MDHYQTIDCECNRCISELYASINRFFHKREVACYNSLKGWLIFLILVIILEKVVVVTWLVAMYMELL